MALIIWLICVVLIAAAVLALVRAVLGVTPFKELLAPYAEVIYALIVLLVVIWIASAFYGAAPFGGPFFPRGVR